MSFVSWLSKISFFQTYPPGIPNTKCLTISQYTTISILSQLEIEHFNLQSSIYQDEKTPVRFL